MVVGAARLSAAALGGWEALPPEVATWELRGEEPRAVREVPAVAMAAADRRARAPAPEVRGAAG